MLGIDSALTSPKECTLALFLKPVQRQSKSQKSLNEQMNLGSAVLLRFLVVSLQVESFWCRRRRTISSEASWSTVPEATKSGGYCLVWPSIHILKALQLVSKMRTLENRRPALASMTVSVTKANVPRVRHTEYDDIIHFPAFCTTTLHFLLQSGDPQ